MPSSDQTLAVYGWVALACWRLVLSNLPRRHIPGCAALVIPDGRRQLIRAQDQAVGFSAWARSFVGAWDGILI